MFGGWGSTYIAASYRLVGHCIDLQTSTLISSFFCSSVGSHPVSVALAAGASLFCRVSNCHAFGGSASTAHASPSLIFCFAPTMLSVGYPESPSVAEGWVLLDYFNGTKSVWSLKTPSQVKAFESALPFCFNVRL